jgi:peptide/nickel transport system substrate-binding protein
MLPKLAIGNLVIRAMVATLLVAASFAKGAGPACAKPAGTVTVAYHDFEREVLDPTLSNTNRPYHGAMFDKLIGNTPKGEYTASLGVLDKWEADADAKGFTLTLKKGIKWHDGVEMTSADLKFTFEYAARPASNCVTCGFLKANLDRVEIVDRYTAKVFIKIPNALFPILLGHIEGDLAVLPKHHFDKVGEAGMAVTPLGSGPWKFVGRKIGEYIEFEANSDYWNPQRIPGFARLRIVLASDPSVRTTMLREGSADLAPLNPEDVERMRQQGFKIMGPQYIGYPMVMLYRSADPAFLTNKLEFRKALTLAVDMDAVVKAFYPPEVATRATGAPLFSPITAGYDASIPGYPYNPEEAKKLLQQIGYKGEEIKFWSFYFTGNPEQLQINEVIASYWRKAGINVNLTPIDSGAFFGKLRTSPQAIDPPAAVGVQVPLGRPSLLQNFLVFMVDQKDGGTIAAYWNPAKILATYKRLTAIADPAARDQTLRQLQRELYDEYWAIPIVWRNQPWAVGRRVGAWQPSNGLSQDLAFETLMPAP